MIVRDDVQRNGYLPGALHATDKRAKQFPHEKYVAGLPIPLLVRELDQAMVI